jgi:hypothetical protein
MPTPKPAHEQRRARMIFEGMSTRSEVNSCLCKQSAKKPTTRDKTKSLGSQKVEPKSKKPRVIRLKYFIMLFPFPFFFQTPS